MILVSVGAGITSALVMEENDEGRLSEMGGRHDAMYGANEQKHPVTGLEYAPAIVGELYPSTPSPSPVPESVVVNATPEPVLDVGEPPESAPIPIAEPYPATPLADIICAHGWDCGSAMAVARCESTLQPWADNGISYGLFALWGGHVKRWPDFWSWWSDPMANAAHAYELYAEQGWVPWHPSSSCSGVY